LTKIPCPLASAAVNFGDKAALAETNRSLTYQELDRQVSYAAGLFLEKGIRAGERVAITECNSFEYVLTLFALRRLGAVACPLNTRYPTSALTQQTERINCKYQIRFSPGKVQHQLSNLNQIEFDLTTDQLCNDAPANNLIELDQPATIIHTSGSTGTPKAVLHSYGNYFFSALGSNRNIPVKQGDRWLLSLPLYHVGGLAILFRCIIGGGTIVITSQAESLLDQVTENNITHLSLVTTQLRSLLGELGEHKVAPTSLRAILLGGSFIPSGLVEEAQLAGLTIFTSYGLTEMASQVATSTAGEPSRLTVLEHCKLKLSDDGEILVKGDTLFSGYISGDDIALPLDTDGWFATGDCAGYDDNDCLMITGRKDNMFVSGGENIHPEQIETALCELLRIENAVVVPVENSEFGFRPVAFIRPDETDLAGFSPEKLRSLLPLPNFMIPIAVNPWPEDYTQSGIKPNRKYFRDLARKLMKTSN